jgi:hypothetical protein
MAIFRANDPMDSAFNPPPPTTPDADPPGLADIASFAINIGTTPIANFGGRITVESITLSFPTQYQNVRIMDAIPAVTQTPPPPATGDDIITPAEPREPRTATLNARMIVEVVIRSGERTITSNAVYEYTGGRFTDDPYGINSDVDDDATFNMVFVPSVPGIPGDPGGYGIWRMIRHEIIDW